jgi:hypothetical protein
VLGGEAASERSIDSRSFRSTAAVSGDEAASDLGGAAAVAAAARRSSSPEMSELKLE